MNTLICERRTYGDTPVTHAHTYGQLLVPIQGALHIAVGRSSMLERETVLYIPPDTHHSFCSHRKNEFFVFDIPLYYLPVNLRENLQLYPVDEAWKAIRALLHEEVNGDEASTGQRLSDLFRYIAGFMDKKKQVSSVEYIKANLDKQITVQELAAIENFNATYYVEWFKRQTGKSPIAYMRDLRLAKAQELLRSTDYSVGQIAQQVGYENQATLARLFQKKISMTPVEYRTKNRSQDKKKTNFSQN